MAWRRRWCCLLPRSDRWTIFAAVRRHRARIYFATSATGLGLAGDAPPLGVGLVESSLAWYLPVGRGRDTLPSSVVESGFGNDGDRLGFGRRGRLGTYECSGDGLVEGSLAGRYGDDVGVLVQRQLTPLYWWPDGAE